MQTNTIPLPYQTLFTDLKSLNNTVNQKVINNDDAFVLANVNFFTKAFTITMCAYLEIYLKDTVKNVIQEIDTRLNGLGVPHNLVRWGVLKDKEEKKNQKFSTFSLCINKDDYEDSVSGNPYKTINIFLKLGIDLNSDSVFKSQVGKIGSIIEKRNKIVHHNDTASDISFTDITANIEYIEEYIRNIQSITYLFLNPSTAVSTLTAS